MFGFNPRSYAKKIASGHGLNKSDIGYDEDGNLMVQRRGSDDSFVLETGKRCGTLVHYNADGKVLKRIHLEGSKHALVEVFLFKVADL